MVVDTVGFVSNLPHELMYAFSATLVSAFISIILSIGNAQDENLWHVFLILLVVMIFFIILSKIKFIMFIIPYKEAYRQLHTSCSKLWHSLINPIKKTPGSPEVLNPT